MALVHIGFSVWKVLKAANDNRKGAEAAQPVGGPVGGAAASDPTQSGGAKRRI